MTQVDTTIVRHIAKLSLIKLSGEQIEKYVIQFTDILGYIDELKQVNTSEVLEMSDNIVGMKNAYNKDVVKKTLQNMLSTTSLPIENNQLLIPKIIKKH